MVGQRIHSDRSTKKLWDFFEQQFGITTLQNSVYIRFENSSGTVVGLRRDVDDNLIATCELPEPAVEMLDGDAYEIITNLAMWFGDSLDEGEFGPQIGFASERVVMLKTLAAALVK